MRRRNPGTRSTSRFFNGARVWLIIVCAGAVRRPSSNAASGMPMSSPLVKMAS